MKTENSNPNIIEISNLNKWYGEFHALKNINLNIKEGEIIVVCGPSGSGKSTLIRCVNFLEKFQEGTLTVNGTELTDDAAKIRSIRSEVSMVFQHFNLFPHLSIIDNLTLAPIWVHNEGKDEAREKALKLLDRVGIKDQAEKYPNQLIGVLLCLILNTHPVKQFKRLLARFILAFIVHPNRRQS